MSDLVRIVLVIAVVALVIGRQVAGEHLRGRRVVLLPVVLIVIGALDVSRGAHRATPLDVALLVANAVVAIGIGLGQGAAMRLQNRDGYLWGRLPLRALWLWVGLVVARVAFTAIAEVAHAHVAAAGSTILLMLGLNRLGHAGVVLARAASAGVPFAPEKSGESFLGGLTGRARPVGVPADAIDLPRTDWQGLARRAAAAAEQRGGAR